MPAIHSGDRRHIRPGKIYHCPKIPCTPTECASKLHRAASASDAANNCNHCPGAETVQSSMSELAIPPAVLPLALYGQSSKFLPSAKASLRRQHCSGIPCTPTVCPSKLHRVASASDAADNCNRCPCAETVKSSMWELAMPPPVLPLTLYGQSSIFCPGQRRRYVASTAAAYLVPPRYAPASSIGWQVPLMPPTTVTTVPVPRRQKQAGGSLLCRRRYYR